MHTIVGAALVGLGRWWPQVRGANPAAGKGTRVRILFLVPIAAGMVGACRGE